MPRRHFGVSLSLLGSMVLALVLTVALPTAAAAQDADGDGIADALDPDDDNDGILDDDEGTISEPPPAEPPDTDDDGIVDPLDPDDNNNAVTDDNEPVPSNNGQDSGGGRGPSSGDGGEASSSGPSGNDTYLVSSLPVTGTGDAPTGPNVWSLLSGLAACGLLWFAHVARNAAPAWNRRQSAHCPPNDAR